MSTASQPSRKPLVVIVGPTAVGKTQVAIGLALRLHGEVVTADSMQVYRGLDIATDKPTSEQMQGVPHHMIDVVAPDEPFNAVKYRDMARAVIEEIHRRGRLPILSGGTGLYVKAVLDDFLFPEDRRDPALRAQLEHEAATLGAAHLHQRLQRVDPASAQRLHPNDVRRVIRALEVFASTGRPLSEQLPKLSGREERYRTVMIGLTRPRPVLYRRIEARVDRQIERGLVDEARRLMAQYPHLPSAGQSLGVKEIIKAIRGEISLDEAIALLKRNTRRYAKRQFTWFRKDERIEWFDLEALSPIERALDAIEEHIALRLDRKLMK